MYYYNTYDKITLITNTVYSFNHDFACDEVYDNNGERLQLKHNQIGLNVFIDFRKNTTMLTFSSKLLKTRALGLISTYSIQSVHEAISQVVNIPYADFQQSTVLKVEITKDVCYIKPEELIESLFRLAQLQTGYKIPSRYYKRAGKACSFWMKKNNTNKKYIDYLSVYDKKAEFLKESIKGNQEFLQSLSIDEYSQFLKDLEDRVRFEVKLHSAYMIRRHFQLGEKTTPTLAMLMDSQVEVVKNMVDRIFKDAVDLKGREYKPKNMTQLAYYLALKENGFNVEQTIAYLRSMLGEVKQCRIKKKLAEVTVGLALMQYSNLIVVYEIVQRLL